MKPKILVASFLSLIVLMLYATTLKADSAPALNKKGNRLYAQKQFVEAEKAYLDAQLQAPGRPELLYNHGNTLIQEKKYEQAAQSLRQAIAKGENGLQASSWYNMGNCQFEAGKFKEAADSYIQALRINPSDRDAKHNLELAWKKLQENQQQSKNKDQNQKNDKNQDPGKSQPQNDPQSGDNKEKPQNSQGNKPEPQSQQQQSAGRGQKEERMSKDQALQLLDAMKNQEMNEQRKMLERQAIQVKGRKDW
jgi:Ca-activated chloride channel homolog